MAQNALTIPELSISQVREYCAEFLRILINDLGLSGQYSTGPQDFAVLNLCSLPPKRRIVRIGQSVSLPVTIEVIRQCAKLAAIDVRSSFPERECFACDIDMVAGFICQKLRDELTGLTARATISEDREWLSLDLVLMPVCDHPAAAGPITLHG